MGSYQARPDEDWPAPEAERTTGESIAIVDDDAAIRQLLAVRFGLVPGVRVAGQAGNGAEAVALAQSAAPDLMILDLQMPVMGGAEAIPLLRAVAPRMRIVVYSARLEGEDLSAPSRPDAAVPKGGNLPELVSVVLGLLDRACADRIPARVGQLAAF